MGIPAVEVQGFRGGRVHDAVDSINGAEEFPKDTRHLVHIGDIHGLPAIEICPGENKFRIGHLGGHSKDTVTEPVTQDIPLFEGKRPEKADAVKRMNAAAVIASFFISA